MMCWELIMSVTGALSSACWYLICRYIDIRTSNFILIFIWPVFINFGHSDIRLRDYLVRYITWYDGGKWGVSLVIDIIFATLDARMTIINTTKISEATHTHSNTHIQYLSFTLFLSDSKHLHTLNYLNNKILELNILDPKPDRPRSKGLVFSDPDKVPRFENLTLEGTVLHSCAVICLWYNTVDHYEQLYSEYYYLAEWNVMVIHVDLTRC